MVLQDLHSQETVRTFTLRAISMQVRSKVRGMHCFVLKPKQDYLISLTPWWHHGKNLLSNAGDMGLISGWRRSFGGENGYPLQNSYLENSMDRGAGWATVLWVTKS